MNHVWIFEGYVMYSDPAQIPYTCQNCGERIIVTKGERLPAGPCEPVTIPANSKAPKVK